MTIDEVRWLFDYNDWANTRTFDAAGTLSHEQMTKDLGSSFPSVLLTLAHIVAAEWVWLQRWLRQPPSTFPAWVSAPEFADIRTRLAAVSEGRRAFFAPMADADLRTSVPFTLLSGASDSQPLDVMVRHIANHSTYHRGQIATFMRQLGTKPPSTDIIVFARERRSEKAGS